MSDAIWPEIQRRMDDHRYMAGVERTVERVRATGEIFTPSALVIEMLKNIPLKDLAPGLAVLDPACGDGQFLVGVKWAKVFLHGMSEDAALRDIYGIDIMRDNVDLCRRRLGGGTIVQGDVLAPERELAGQTAEDRTLVRALCGRASQQSLFNARGA
jgi:hypothetical protein